MTDQIIVRTTSRREGTDSGFWSVAAFCAIGLLVTLNVILRFPELGAIIAQYNLF
jgi:hypothetical protein